MRETSLIFVKRFANDDAVLLRDARETLARLTRVWRHSAGLPLPDRYADLYEAVDTEIDSVKQRTSIPIPCARGCNHCCKFNEILISRYEAVLLVRYIENLQPADRAAVVARILSAASKSGGGIGAPCALLDDEHGCSVYARRPLPCRGYYSISEPACREHLHGAIRTPPNLAATRIVEYAALDVASEKHAPFEINTLLRRIYSDPAKLASWAAGQPTDEPDLSIDGKK
jgi:Fe-S-cluster containining protein